LEVLDRSSSDPRAPKSLRDGLRPASNLLETLGAPSPATSSEELDPDPRLRLRAPKSSSTSPHGLASTPPWKRLTTSDPRPSSEELDLELPTPSGAPRSTFAHRRETASRLRGNAPRPLTLAGLRGTRRRAAGSLRRSEERRGQPARDRATPPCERPSARDDHVPRPEGRGTRPKSTSGPSRDPFTCRWNASLVRRPPRHPASLLPSPRTLPQTPPHLSTPRGTSAKEANTSRPCGPVDRPRERRATPKGSSSDLQPVSRSSGLITCEPSRRQAAPKSDSAKLELSAEPHGSGRTKRCTTLGLRRASGRSATSRSRAQDDRLTALVTPRAPEGARGEPAATDWPPRERCAGRAGCIEAPKNLSAGRSRSGRPRLSLSTNAGSLVQTRRSGFATGANASRLVGAARPRSSPLVATPKSRNSRFPPRLPRTR